MKKVIKSPEQVVPEMLRGMGSAHSGLIRIIPEYNVVVRADAPVSGKVALVLAAAPATSRPTAGTSGLG